MDIGLPPAQQESPPRPGLATVFLLASLMAGLFAGLIALIDVFFVRFVWVTGNQVASTTLFALWFLILADFPLLLLAWWLFDGSRQIRRGGPVGELLFTRRKVMTSGILCCAWMVILCSGVFTVVVSADRDDVHWNVIKDSQEIRVFEHYLGRWPKGKHRTEAETRRSSLVKENEELLARLLAQVSFLDYKEVRRRGLPNEKGPPFRPPYFIVDQSGTRAKEWASAANLGPYDVVKQVSLAKTLVVCRESHEGGRILYANGAETGRFAKTTILSCCLIDVSDPTKTRSLNAEATQDSSDETYDQTFEIIPELMERVRTGRP
jgi:hypothetical protein